ncbi:sulfotransferase [Fodinibius sp. Rm-B-1B1-1]|uniref:sulfotransferase family protein n=1 Tax=Fodinibius alkaliphilus TaxID=3140241 RepID=UPI00315B07A2
MAHEQSSEWIAPNPSQLPDFIIGGAMKSGTTTLHSILDQHPNVFIPKKEQHFFDFDNLLQHSAFNFFDGEENSWIRNSMSRSPQQLWEDYLSNYDGKESSIKGEDSTTYLASSIAAKRIAMQPKDIKLIFLLRHPTHRAYSQYFHLLRSGRAIFSFEDTLMFTPEKLLQRSLYNEQLQYYYDLIPRERIKVVLFEDLISKTKNTVAEICTFLDLDFQKFDNNILTTHSNKTKLPSSITLQIYYNRLFRKTANLRHVDSLPESPSPKEKRRIFFLRLIKKAHRMINPLQDKEKPPIKKSTQQFLDQFFQRRLSGINNLVGKEILSTWFSDTNDTSKNS